MYKKLLPALFAALGPLAASAQIPTLTSSTNPVIGDSHLIYSTDSFNVGSGGASATWDFSTLPINATDTLYYSACSASPYCSDFPGTTVYAHQPGNPASVYNNTSAGAISLAGEYSTGPVAYTNYEDMLRYPFTYNSTFVDSFAATFVSGGNTYNRKGASTVTADGYGTLILPNGTYTNALRVYMTEDYSDSTVISGIPFGYSYLTYTYIWYVPNARQGLLFQSQTTTSLGTVTPKRAQFTDQTPASIAALSTNNLQSGGTSLLLYPNPVSDELNIDFSLENAGHVRISVIDIVGREVAIITDANFNAGKQHLNFATMTLRKGMYIVKMQSDKETSIRKIEVL